ncbi:anthranilate synthase component I family protein [Cohnella lupini]|uniref:Para-aminobenzoate synthetase component 1 n=1 Tax=Cohnella lupini TaxID=1294267 RepID=A0A3D9HU96_9BACL|nr:anthranilate synthase component I family protein [Cohnella lupini]RED53072.1 para-aminobenzoate synthetase component 1 [Cohnella lupini]
MEVIALKQWERWSNDGDYALLPYVRKLALDSESLLPVFWDLVWKEASAYGCLLESGKGGRYTIVGLRPESVIEGKGDRARILERRDEDWVETSVVEGAPLTLLREWMSPWAGPRPDGVPDCIGGILGFWSYDIVRSLERLPVLARDDLDLPDYVFQRYEELWIADHRDNEIYSVVHVHCETGMDATALGQRYRDAQHRAMEMERQWLKWSSASRTADRIGRASEMRSKMDRDQMQIDVENIPGLTTSMSKSDYQSAVRRIREYIGQGDVFQVNLSFRQSLRTDISPETLYDWLRLVNPSPYMGMLRSPDFALVSASPELLVKLDEGRLSTRPIAGTRRRGLTPEEDRAMEAELLASEKERAEHVMLVDLERNDLGRVAEYGTVKVPELMTVERYSHVMHLVSQVEGRIAQGKDALDVLAAVFPGGTITGAPKIRTMEIIEELEPTRRGPYTGSMGWIDYNGNMEFNIIIRTITVKNGVCHIQAGAGIVIDSEPEREFYECLNKAKALWKAVQYSEGQGEPI